MPGMPLFCTAEEAKPRIPEILRLAKEKEGYEVFYLIESRTCPDDASSLKTALEDNETFNSEFLGASEEELRDWYLMHEEVRFFGEDFIAIADARTAVDGTILMQWYGRGLHVKSSEYETGALPVEPYLWHNYRIQPQGASVLIASLSFVTPDASIPYISWAQGGTHR